MRKKTVFLSLFVALFSLSNCNKEKCLSCIEHNTNTTTSYCGKDSEFFEDELIRQGQAAGQDWTCEEI